MHIKRFAAVLFLIIAGTLLATLGTHEPGVSLSALRLLWSDALRDTDQVGMQLTRVSDAEEMQLGREIALNIPAVYPMDNADSLYLNEVGAQLVYGVRRPGIDYTFHVVESPAINAFALPGGRIYVTSAMLGFVDSEAELAAILGHEISHVDLRHCIERYQYRPLGAVVEIAHAIATLGFSQDQESDADAQGVRLSMQAGYDPRAASALFTRMGAHFGEVARPPAGTPQGELGQAAISALTDYFRSHPPSAERAKRLKDLVAGRHGSFYIGRQNLRRRMARSRSAFRNEWETL